MLEISARLEEAMNRAFIKVFPKQDQSSKTSSILTGSNLVPASKPEFGDFQINCALSLAKELKQSPREIAQQNVKSISCYFISWLKIYMITLSRG